MMSGSQIKDMALCYINIMGDKLPHTSLNRINVRQTSALSRLYKLAQALSFNHLYICTLYVNQLEYTILFWDIVLSLYYYPTQKQQISLQLQVHSEISLWCTTWCQQQKDINLGTSRDLKQPQTSQVHLSEKQECKSLSVTHHLSTCVDP